jgi:hypothetical protein
LHDTKLLRLFRCDAATNILRNGIDAILVLPAEFANRDSLIANFNDICTNRTSQHIAANAPNGKTGNKKD